MSKVAPWHSNIEDVHHTDTNCSIGEKIKRINIRYGTGRKPQCPQCKRLN